MIRIIQSGDERAVAALLDRAAGRDVTFERRVARIVGDVRVRGDRALLSYAKKHDGLTGSPEITRAEMARGEHLISIASTDGKVNATSLPYFIIIGEEEEPALIPAYPLEDTTE